jgi:ribonuclease P protein component
MDQRFPPEHRLHDGRDYSRVFNRQQKAAGRHVVVLLRPRENSTVAARLGIMIAAKTVNTAVRRHQLKRWVRELFRTTLQSTVPGHDVVVLFRSDPHALAHQELGAEISALAARALTLRPASSAGHRSAHRRAKPGAPGPTAGPVA